MPYKSQAQRRFFFAAEARGDLPKGTAMDWAVHTPSISSLPELAKAKKKSTKKSSVEGLYALLVGKVACSNPTPRVPQGLLQTSLGGNHKVSSKEAQVNALPSVASSTPVRLGEGASIALKPTQQAVAGKQMPIPGAGQKPPQMPMTAGVGVKSGVSWLSAGEDHAKVSEVYGGGAVMARKCEDGDKHGGSGAEEEKSSVGAHPTTNPAPHPDQTTQPNTKISSLSAQLYSAAPFAAAFVRRCQDLGLSPDRFEELTKLASDADPDFAREFETLKKMCKEANLANLLARLGGAVQRGAGAVGRAGSAIAEGLAGTRAVPRSAARAVLPAASPASALPTAAPAPAIPPLVPPSPSVHPMARGMSTNPTMSLLTPSTPLATAVSTAPPPGSTALGRPRVAPAPSPAIPAPSPSVTPAAAPALPAPSLFSRASDSLGRAGDFLSARRPSGGSTLGNLGRLALNPVSADSVGGVGRFVGNQVGRVTPRWLGGNYLGAVGNFLGRPLGHAGNALIDTASGKGIIQSLMRGRAGLLPAVGYGAGMAALPEAGALFRGEDRPSGIDPRDLHSMPIFRAADLPMSALRWGANAVLPEESITPETGRLGLGRDPQGRPYDRLSSPWSMFTNNLRDIGSVAGTTASAPFSPINQARLGNALGYNSVTALSNLLTSPAGGSRFTNDPERLTSQRAELEGLARSALDDPERANLGYFGNAPSLFGIDSVGQEHRRAANLLYPGQGSQHHQVAIDVARSELEQLQQPGVATSPQHQARIQHLQMEMSRRTQALGVSAASAQTGQSPQEVLQDVSQGSGPSSALSQSALFTEMRSINPQVQPEAVQSIWGGMSGMQKFGLIAGLGLSLVGLLGTFSGGHMLWAGPLLAALGLGGAAMALSGGNPRALMQGSFWSRLLQNQSPTQNRPAADRLGLMRQLNARERDRQPLPEGFMGPPTQGQMSARAPMGTEEVGPPTFQQMWQGLTPGESHLRDQTQTDLLSMEQQQRLPEGFTGPPGPNQLPADPARQRQIERVVGGLTQPQPGAQPNSGAVRPGSIDAYLQQQGVSMDAMATMSPQQAQQLSQGMSPAQRQEGLQRINQALMAESNGRVNLSNARSWSGSMFLSSEQNAKLQQALQLALALGYRQS